MSFRTAARPWLPERLRERVRAKIYARRWGFEPPPAWSDWVGYEVLLEELERNRVDRITGDVLEIGPLLGGGTAKLCGWFGTRAPEKRIISIDVFDTSFDDTVTAQGWPMADLYRGFTQGRDQRAVFDHVTRACTNLIVIPGDSTTVAMPTEHLAFAFIDGSHVPAVVRSDFKRAWKRMSPGGVAAFHDYGGDLPDVTRTLTDCIGDHAKDIARVWTRDSFLLFVQRT